MHLFTSVYLGPGDGDCGGREEDVLEHPVPVTGDYQEIIRRSGDYKNTLYLQTCRSSARLVRQEE